METHTVLVADAFGADPMTGTPVGIVRDGDRFGDDRMDAIASELGATATAFLSDSDRADRRVDIRSPTLNPAQCPHAAIAANALLYERDDATAEEFTVETSHRILDMEIKPDGTVWIEQGTAESREGSVSHAEIAEMLNIDVASLRDIGADLPVAVGSLAEPWLLIPVNYFEHLSDIDPDMRTLAELCDRLDIAGVYAFTFDTIGPDATLTGRAIEPGIGERLPTGTEAAAVSAYIRGQGAIDETIDPIVVEQGQFRNRPGTVRVDTDGTEVWIGGRAVTTLDGSLTVPAEDDDGIIEA
jgi:PhzF family phenazine biosynthesis protein